MDKQTILGHALYRLFRPIVRIGLRHGLAVGDVVEIMKSAYVDVAGEEYGLRGRPANKSRIAALSGLTRVEVTRLVERGREQHGQVGSNHPLHRLVNRWMSDPAWQDEQGQAAILTTDGEPGFPALVQAQGGGIPWQTMLRELERLMIVRREGSKVFLIQNGFIPADDEDITGLPFIGEDAAALLDTLDYNLHAVGTDKRFQRKVVYPGLTECGLRILQNHAATQGQQLLEALDKQLAPYVSPHDTSSGRLTGLGVYVFDLNNPEGEGL